MKKSGCSLSRSHFRQIGLLIKGFNSNFAKSIRTNPSYRNSSPPRSENKSCLPQAEIFINCAHIKCILIGYVYLNTVTSSYREIPRPTTERSRKVYRCPPLILKAFLLYLDTNASSCKTPQSPDCVSGKGIIPQSP